MARYIALIDGKAGAYGVVFPDLPGCAMGKTMDEALANAADALREWAAVTEDGGGKIPRPRALESLRRDAEEIGARGRRRTRHRSACP